MALDIAIGDPAAEDVRALLATHLALARRATPAEYSFALEAEHLSEPAIVFFTARDDGRLVGVAALKRIDDGHAELKSMHTREADRGRGVARSLVNHLLTFAKEAGYQRVSLETGTTEEFLPARALYRSCGFKRCPPFGDYSSSPYNMFMTTSLGDDTAPTPNGSQAVAADSSPT